MTSDAMFDPPVCQSKIWGLGKNSWPEKGLGRSSVANAKHAAPLTKTSFRIVDGLNSFCRIMLPVERNDPQEWHIRELRALSMVGVIKQFVHSIIGKYAELILFFDACTWLSILMEESAESAFIAWHCVDPSSEVSYLDSLIPICAQFIQINIRDFAQSYLCAFLAKLRGRRVSHSYAGGFSVVIFCRLSFPMLGY
jgi:hypothetical protein